MVKNRGEVSRYLEFSTEISLKKSKFLHSRGAPPPEPRTNHSFPQLCGGGIGQTIRGGHPTLGPLSTYASDMLENYLSYLREAIPYAFRQAFFLSLYFLYNFYILINFPIFLNLLKISRNCQNFAVTNSLK